jgi:gliding motility-associated-like protein
VEPPSPQLQGTPIQFFDGSSANGTIITGVVWTLDGEEMPWTGLMPDWLDAMPGEHVIGLTLITADGCTDTYTLPYVITAGEIMIPNVFSPNGDGSNDRFVIPNVQYHRNRLKIFNRWGMLVYEMENYKNQWSGTGLLEGTYYYVLNLDDGRNLAGHVTLLR